MKQSLRFLLLLMGVLAISSLVVSCVVQQKIEEKTESKKNEVENNYVKYFSLVGEAKNLYETKKYKESALKYDEAFKAINGEGDTNDKYNASRSSALSGDFDKAFEYLFYIATENKYTKLKKLEDDEHLSILHNDERWNTLLNLVAENKKEIEKNFDMKLVAELDSIYERDQDCRTKLDFFVKKYGKDSKEVEDLTKECKHIDSTNQIKVSRILDERGWLGKEIIGKKGNLTLFLVLQHADNNIDMQLKYLPMFKKAVLDGKANPDNFAMFQDRVRLKQGKKQIYGSQIGKDDKTGKYIVNPIEDPINVDKRRKEVGLGSMADYVKQWGIVWDAEKQEKLQQE